MRAIAIILATLALASCAAADQITVPAPDCAPTAQATGAGTRIAAPGFATAADPGDPALPYKDIYVILPPNADPSSVRASLTGRRTTTSALDADLAPAPPIATDPDGATIRSWGKGRHIERGRNTLIYGKNALHPGSNVRLISVGNLRQYRMARLRYYPYRYNPVAKQLERSSGGSLTIAYNTSALSTSRQLRTDSGGEAQVQAIAANYAQARSWYASTTPTATLQASQPTADYVVITTAAIAAASTKLQSFVTQKIARGHTVEVDTEAQWGGGLGDAAANNIRAFLQSNYLAKGIHYVLLIGNPDPAAGDVPMKMLWPRYNEDSYRQAPSDYFYADLTGNWDLDGDGYYGESIGDFGTGGVDLLPEVIVGRIPCYGDYAALDSILQKTMDYENGSIRGAWLRKVLVTMKPSDSDTPGYQLGEAIKAAAAVPAGMAATRVYENTYGLSPSPEYAPCTYDNTLSAWQQHAGFHIWWTHGTETTAVDVFTTNSCQYLDDAYPSFTFQCSCLNGSPEATSNLGFSLLKRGAIATDSASRVSWYYPGEDIYTDTDSNAGMAYQYAVKLIRDHMPCGNAHYAMMLAVPNNIWMNHCVFNLYGDPSIKYPSAPVISHTPLTDTDVTTQPYTVNADIGSSAPLATGSPILKWNTTGDANFTIAPMTHTAGTMYTASIPAQSYGVTVHYAIDATDSQGATTSDPPTAPEDLFTFQVRQDTGAPQIAHTPIADTGNKFGPYHISATITDDLGIADASVHYSTNAGTYQTLPMRSVGANVYEADIPGPMRTGDTVSYYLTATDSSLGHNSTRLPESGTFSFRIAQKTYVAVFNSASNPPYFVGGNSNAWSEVAGILNADPAQRFQATALTTLKTTDSSTGLSGQDALVLPDNGVPVDSLQAVADWFKPGKVIVAMDSAVCWATYVGWMWDGSAGSAGYSTYWDYDAGDTDQQITASDPITAGYTVGQMIGSVNYDAEYFVDKLPSDAHVLSVKADNPNHCYAVYRDVPGRGRLVLLGPYVPPLDDEYAIIREAVMPPPQPRQIEITAPSAGQSFEAGSTIRIAYTTSGTWLDGDKIRLEYCTGLDTAWHQIPGAEAIAYESRGFDWATSGLPGSHAYTVRATCVGNAATAKSSTFSIVPTLEIPAAKSVADGGIVKLAGKVVTSAVDGHVYIEEPNRRAGIRLTGTTGLSIMGLVTVTGSMDTVDGERVLAAENTEILGAGARLSPYYLRTDAMGGGGLGLQQAVEQMASGSAFTQASGANNIGLLVRICGAVTASGADWFYVDDGCRCDDGSGNLGVKVICPGITPPTTGFVLLNGISSTYQRNGHLFRALLLPDKESLRTLAR